MKRVIGEALLRRPELQDLESESEMSGGTVSSNVLRLECTHQV